MFPEAFEFSQASLQDYVDCRRRFQLRYLQRQPWPAIEVEPALELEAYGAYGQQFHRALEGYFSGVPADLVEEAVREEPLYGWWRAFLEEPPLNLPEALCVPEVRLSASLAGQRVVAVFDLLAVDPGRRLVIVDWKTGRFRPSREVMQGRLQTLVYPFVAVEAGGRLFGGEVDPARVTMVYWFANFPGQPHVFHYSAAAHGEVRAYLGSLVEEVVSLGGAGEWALAADVERCRFCVYRSLCGRGVAPGWEESGAGVLDDGVGGVVWELGWVDEVAY
ncbi:MAG: hypothetical protein Kow0063_02790 [Anaerolineae bacterium]